MNKEAFQKLTEFAKTRFTRLLILLVIFTFGFSMRTAVMAKYASYLNNMTSVVAGDFIFKSNYLYEDGSTYVINSYDGQQHELSIDLMNYENSLRYNPKDLDFFYTVEAKVYADSQCTQDITSQYKVKITLGSNDGAVAAIRKSDSVKYGLIRGLDVGGIEEQGEGLEPKVKTYEELIKGGYGKSLIKVFIEANDAMTTGGTIYLKIWAKTVPLARMKAELAEGADILEFQSDYTAENVIAPERGVYYTELYATFVLNHTVGDAEIYSEFFPGSNTGYDVTYKIRCAETANGTATVRVFYDPSKVTPEESLGTPILDKETGKRYLQIGCQSGGTVTLKFYKNRLNVELTENDFYFEKVLDSSQIDESFYDVTVASSAEGTVTIDHQQSKMMGDVEVTVTPPDKQMINGIHIRTASDYPVPLLSTSVDKNGVGVFKFKMPNENVTVLPVYCHIIQLTVGEHGKATLSKSGAPIGTPISITMEPDEGYKVGTLSVKDGSGNEISNVVNEGNNAYSFMMPEGETTVSVTFVEDKVDEDIDQPQNPPGQ